MFKKIFVCIVPVVLISTMLFACNPTNSTTSNDTIQSLEEYNASIDYSCNHDQDCEVKNVGNCCGYYPACTNVNAKADSKLVNKLCQKESVAGICGFPSIESCQCINNKCQHKSE